MAFFSCRLLTTPIFPIFPRCLSISLLNLATKKIILFGYHPPDGVIRGGPPAFSIVTPLYSTLFSQNPDRTPTFPFETLAFASSLFDQQFDLLRPC